MSKRWVAVGFWRVWAEQAQLVWGDAHPGQNGHGDKYGDEDDHDDHDRNGDKYPQPWKERWW